MDFITAHWVSIWLIGSFISFFSFLSIILTNSEDELWVDLFVTAVLCLCWPILIPTRIIIKLFK